MRTPKRTVVETPWTALVLPNVDGCMQEDHGFVPKRPVRQRRALCSGPEEVARRPGDIALISLGCVLVSLRWKDACPDPEDFHAKTFPILTCYLGCGLR